MPYIVLAPALAFQRTDPNKPTVPVGDEEIVRKGGEVPDYVPTYVTTALVAAGNIVYADRPMPELFPAEDLPAQVRTPEMPAVLPSDPNGTPLLPSDLVTDAGPEVAVDVPPASEPGPADAPLPALPKASDSKDAWEQYATHPRIGMSLAQAEAMNKADLMSTVKQRYEAAR